MSAEENVEVASRIFHDHGTTIRSMVKRYVHGEQDADDICQDIFLSIAASPPSHETAILAYLQTVVRNHVRDFHRRATSRQGFAKRYAQLPTTTAIGSSREGKFEQAEQVAKVMALLKDALPEHMAHVVIERYVHGKNVDEIAAKLGIEKRSISRYCCVGLRCLRSLLDEEASAHGHELSAESPCAEA
jgi:RNA polymerase sigma factor (sigma-70 family)